MSVRTEKVASLVKEEIGKHVAREFNNAAFGLITVTEVRMTPDLKIARVYVSILGSPEIKERTLKVLEDQKPAIRHTVAMYVRLRFTPEIQFYLDDTMDRVERIEHLIKKIHGEDQ
jgi:ribosome-binding factor A